MTLPWSFPSWFGTDLDELELTELDIIFDLTEYISFYKIFAGVLERDRRQETGNW